MKYLFFDIECANCYNNCAKIFSLGYLITDENFNILHEKEDVLINPHDRFDWYVAKKMMAYPRSIFGALPSFPEFYERFREMFEDPDTIVIGYAVTNDVHFLQDDCRRYGLAPFAYRFYDVQQIYARQPENNTAKNLEDSLLAWCGVEAENLHRSDEDAYNTMRILKAIAEYHGTNLAGILEKYPDCAGETKDGNIDYAWKKPEPEGGKKKRHRGGKGRGKASPAPGKRLCQCGAFCGVSAYRQTEKDPQAPDALRSHRDREPCLPALPFQRDAVSCADDRQRGRALYLSHQRSGHAVHLW